MSRIHINKPVAVTSVGFRKNLGVYPRRIEFQGVTYDFIDAGLRCLVRHGERIAEIITLSDGITDYFLRTDNCGGDWTLLGKTS
ncbi:MAG: hypothetical protein PWQ10_384 [Patescibacteria group bacterium]|nr:hypothetical protein [Patescibacteria group bacterium]